MSNSAPANDQPPKLRMTHEGGADIGSLADILEWFLNFDERTARMRLPAVEELFQWKQQDDKVNGVAIYPFENAEARFAVGAFQALAENDTEPKLNAWITDILNAISDARQARTELTEAYDLDADHEMSAVAKSNKLTTALEKRMYLTSSWIENLCTAEARFLGWVYQELYGKPFTPSIVEPE
ncbi:MAG: hypothetical protein KA746_09700 [Pyrinomonadaceae bacterium]|nr:hypothetical protein [Pyrinomonadaceae bacterium]MBP6212723.1 hypothetical protein [Pyrinomonadaceae bacterium]